MSACRPHAGLAAAAEAAERRASASGVLEPLRSVAETVEDGGIGFEVRRLLDASRKPHGRHAQARDPFSDPEPDVVVAPVSDTHLCLLNRYPVLRRPLLLVTRDFVPQEAWLDAADWTALAVALRELDALGFYNGGPGAGASQPHKHLQVVELAELAPRHAPRLAIEPWLAGAPPGPGPSRLPGVPFAHAFARIDPDWLADPGAAGARLAAAADAALAAVGVRPVATPEGRRQSGPYNVLVTRRWLLAVPRVSGAAEGISVNALGFAGSFVVSSDEQLARVRRSGPIALLRAVAGPA